MMNTINDYVNPRGPEDDDDDDDEGYILEVQRRRGCSVAMRNFRRQLYKVVMAIPYRTGKSGDDININNCNNSAKMIPIAGTRPRRFRTKYHQQQQYNNILPGVHSLPTSFGHDTATAALAMVNWQPRMLVPPPAVVAAAPLPPSCLELLESKRREENCLGMETLLDLSNPDRVGNERAEEVAHALAFGDGMFGQRLRALFLQYFRWPTSDRATSTGRLDGTDFEDVSSLECVTEVGKWQEVHLLSLKVLTRCLDIILANEQDYLSNEATMLDFLSDFWSDVMIVLLMHLKECSCGPQEAALSARCLRILESLKPGLLIPITAMSIVPLSVNAHKFGKNHHLLLENESQKLLQCLKLVK